MKHCALSVAGLLFVLAISACGEPADDAARNYAKFLKEQTAKLDDGSFDSGKFTTEGKMLIGDIRKRAPGVNGKFPDDYPLSQDVRNEISGADWDFRQASKRYAEASRDWEVVTAYNLLMLEFEGITGPKE